MLSSILIDMTSFNGSIVHIPFEWWWIDGHRYYILKSIVKPYIKNKPPKQKQLGLRQVA